MELAINNEIDRFSLAIDAIDRVPKLQRSARTPRSASATCRSIAGIYAHQHGIDAPEITGWKWPL